MEIESKSPTINSPTESPTIIEKKLLNVMENASGVPDDKFNIKHEDVCVSLEESTSEIITNSVNESGSKKHKELERQGKVILRKSFEPNRNNILSKRTRYRSNKSIIESAIARKEQYFEPYEKPKNKRGPRIKVILNNDEKDSKSSSSSKIICDNERKNNDLSAKSVESDHTSSVRSSPRKIIVSESKKSIETKRADEEAIKAKLVYRLCKCTEDKDLYNMKAFSLGAHFCSATDSIDGKFFGCSREIDVNIEKMLRPSARVSFGQFCDSHKKRLTKHNCCSYCGTFCTQGDFLECPNKHHYHTSCRLSLNGKCYCPHCGLDSTSSAIIHIKICSTAKPVISVQRPYPDISRGRETNPIQCYNDIDDKCEPRDYSYITKNCVTSDLHVNMNIKAIKPCFCVDRCNSLDCACAKLSLRCWYDDDGKLVPEFNFCDPPLIFECNDLCECNKILCKNRLVQKPLTQRFQLFRTKCKGWGIKSLNIIPLGNYVCEYIGELMTDTEAELREDDSYLFDLDNKETDSYAIDAKFYSNFARFINHSCDPNLHPVKVFVDHHDLRFPRIALFAKKHIQAEEELSFDYGEKFWLIKYKSFTCECRADNCKYSKEAIGKILEKYHMPL